MASHRFISTHIQFAPRANSTALLDMLVPPRVLS